MSADALKKGKQKANRGQPPRWKSPGLRDAKGGIEQPEGVTQQVCHGHHSNHKVGHYEGALWEVIDSAREALSVYLLTEDPFPMDVILQNDELDELENPRRTIK